MTEQQLLTREQIDAIENRVTISQPGRWPLPELLSHARAAVERIEAKDKVLLQVWEAINSNGAQRPWTGTKRHEWDPNYHFEVTLSAKDYFDIKAALERTPR